MKIFNSLTREVEEFKPVNPPKVGMYTCGPTVYSFTSIGNFRTYVVSDILRRVLSYSGYEVKSVMNITDVGHLTGDNLGDADVGQDRLEVAAEREHKTAWNIANFYTDAFVKDMHKLNILAPDVMPKATDHIKEQITLIKKLEEEGLTYKTSDGIYFDTKIFEEKTGKKYGELSTLDEIKEGARVEKNPEKKDPRDFALWKFSDSTKHRQMEWNSPWGVGFPGWHIECSAMSLKYLTESFDPSGKLSVNGDNNLTIDIHLGGEDLRQTHHPNEIAQSEGVTGKPFVKYWVHTTFLLVDVKRMSKSAGNVYTIDNIEEQGIDPLALRYLFLTTHYRDPLNFTWEGLKAAETAYGRLKNQFLEFSAAFHSRVELSGEKLEKVDQYRQQFREAMNNDLNTPQALAVVWEVIKSNVPEIDKRDLLLSFDEVLGLGFAFVQPIEVPDEVNNLIEERENLRKEGKWTEADSVRNKIKELGYEIEDTAQGARVKLVK